LQEKKLNIQLVHLTKEEREMAGYVMLKDVTGEVILEVTNYGSNQNYHNRSKFNEDFLAKLNDPKMEELKGLGIDVTEGVKEWVPAWAK